MADSKTIAQRPALLIAATAGGLLVITLLLVWSFSGGSTQQTAPGKAYFTVDDGKTWFQDDVSRIAPFDHNGKTAYRCYLFTGDEGRTMKVGYLERYNEEARALMESHKREKRVPNPLDHRTLMAGAEVKRPGDKTWISRNDPRAHEITSLADDKHDLVPVE